VSSALSYPILCAPGAFAQVAQIVGDQAPAHRIVVISDEAVAAHYGAALMAQLAAAFPSKAATLLTIPPGEQEKTRARWGELTDRLLAWGAGRDTTIIALGGGVIGDLAGFVAATFMRGVPVVQVPTTLLAMVDASVGGKTAVDTPMGKNLVGAFHDPAAVVMDPALLGTLSLSHFRTGLAEMLKHGIIADSAYLDAMLAALPSLLADRGRAQALPALIEGSVRIKSAVVAEDHREGGRRQILNFGHTIGHAIEKLRHYAMLHGDAVAIGMVAESRIAEALGVAAPGLTTVVRAAVEAAGLPSGIPADLAVDAIVAETVGDKKARAGTAHFALPNAVGSMDEAGGRWSLPVSIESLGRILSES
jgi:3-dehydroquinate synthase